MIENWKSRARELVEQDNFRLHPVTQKLAELAKSSIQAINTILQTDEEIAEVKRRSLIREKKVHEHYLQLFSADPIAELEQIAQAVSDEIN